MDPSIPGQNLALVDGPDSYSGLYVALRSFADRAALCHGSVPEDVLSAAKKLGVADPVLVFVPEKGMIHIY